MFSETSINSSTRSSNFATQYGSKFVKKFEIFFATNAITTSNDDRSVLDVDVALFDVTIDDRNYEIGIANIFVYIKIGYWCYMCKIRFENVV
jgi:hypothetical protein